MLKAKLVAARETRGWSVGKAAARPATIHQFALRKLESGQTDPAKCSSVTMTELLNLYYPDLNLADFVGAEIAGYLVAIKRRPHRGRPRKDDTR